MRLVGACSVELLLVEYGGFAVTVLVNVFPEKVVYQLNHTICPMIVLCKAN